MAPRFIKDGMSHDRRTITRLMAKVGRTPSALDTYNARKMRKLALHWIEAEEIRKEEERLGISSGTSLRFKGPRKYDFP